MARRQLAWLAALIIPVLALGGFTGVLIVHAEATSKLRVAQAAYDDARALATKAAIRADTASTAADELADHAALVVADARTYQGLAGLDATALAALEPLAVAVEAALEVPPPARATVPEPLVDATVDDLRAGEADLRAWAAALDADWDAYPVGALQERVEALEAASIDVAATVEAAGAGVLAATPGATPESRMALQAAMDAVAEDIAADRNPLDSVVAYTAAAKAAKDSQAAADAAAAAAAAEAANEQYDTAPRVICFDFPPITLPNGMVYDSPPACLPVQ